MPRYSIMNSNEAGLALELVATDASAVLNCVNQRD